MKKTYTKPYIAAESFQLNAAIAAACSTENKMALGYGENSCVPVDAGGFFGDKCVHDITPSGDGNDYICYHGPTAPTTIAMYS